jgi:peptide/nickel transport system substrate-binding protein
VYTIERAIDPETASPVAGTLLGPVTKAETMDDHTLVITLSEPFFPFLTNLTAAGYLMPLSQATVESLGDDYGRQPLSVGPYIFREWRTGDVIILERNPNFNWGPSFAQARPYNIETIEFRFLPDPTTLRLALEAGEIDQAEVAGKDVELIRETGQFEIYEVPLQGASPIGGFNLGQPPFDDIRVRQAFNLAVNRTGLIQIAVQGQAEIQYGPISPSVLGYWPGVEEIGYNYDVDRARTLLFEAGYRPNADGILEKDGRPLSFPLLVGDSRFATVAEVLIEQYEAIGADVSIEVLESGVAFERYRTRDYKLMLFGIEFPDADVLYFLYHSTKGSMPLSGLSDTELNTILDKTRLTVEPKARQEWVNLAQARIVEQAYILPLYAPTIFTAVSKRVEGLLIRPDGSFIYNDAYIVEK